MLLARPALRLRPFVLLHRVSMQSLSTQSPRKGEKRSISPSAPRTVSDSKRLRCEGESTVMDSGNVPSLKNNLSADKKQVKGARKRRRKLENIESCSRDDVYWHETSDLLGKETVEKSIEEETDLDSPFELREEIELDIQAISSNGEPKARSIELLC